MSGGFRPVNDINGTAYNGQVQSYYVTSSHATLLQVGDLVTISGDVTTVGDVSYQNVDASTNTSLITGVIAGIAFNPSNLEQAGLPASTAGVVQVAPAFPDLLLSAEISATITSTAVGQNAAIVATAASLSGGLAVSNMQINTSSVGTASNQIRIENLIEGALTANSRVYCRINPAYSTVAGSVGI